MSAKFWAVVPAAGSGSRMQSDIPKQYLPLQGKTVLECSLTTLLSHPAIASCVVVLSANDELWPTLEIANHPNISTVIGGAERADSVLAGLEMLLGIAQPQDWVLVHDAARPCLTHSDIDCLLAAVKSSKCGGILAQPVVETVKQTNHDHEITSTIDRNTVFLAQTPQCFRLAELADGYRDAIQAGAVLTDEASVLERLGKDPVVVPCQRHNIKITHPQDLALAEFYLSDRNV